MIIRKGDEQGLNYLKEMAHQEGLDYARKSDAELNKAGHVLGLSSVKIHPGGEATKHGRQFTGPISGGNVARETNLFKED